MLTGRADLCSIHLGENIRGTRSLARQDSRARVHVANGWMHVLVFNAFKLRTRVSTKRRIPDYRYPSLQPYPWRPAANALPSSVFSGFESLTSTLVLSLVSGLGSLGGERESSLRLDSDDWYALPSLPSDVISVYALFLALGVSMESYSKKWKSGWSVTRSTQLGRMCALVLPNSGMKPGILLSGIQPPPISMTNTRCVSGAPSNGIPQVTWPQSHVLTMRRVDFGVNCNFPAWWGSSSWGYGQALPCPWRSRRCLGRVPTLRETSPPCGRAQGRGRLYSGASLQGCGRRSRYMCPSTWASSAHCFA